MLSSSLLPLSRSTVDRSAHLRIEPDLITRLCGVSSTRVIVARDATVLTRGGGDPRLAHLTPAEVNELIGEAAARGIWTFLGDEPGGDCAVLGLLLPADGVDLSQLTDVPVPDGADAPAAGPLVWSRLREIGAVLDATDAGLATAAVALASWHDRHRFCPRCGAATEPISAGWVSRCTDDGSEHYPRTDPAVIMAVVDPDDRILLGNAAQWGPGRYSTLAGFVEAGESAEQAVRREVVEESRIQIGAVHYRGSQPWPFPASLMLAFRAEAISTDQQADGLEVLDARWFTREELAAAVADGQVSLPTRTSIARWLIEDWYGAELSGSW